MIRRIDVALIILLTFYSCTKDKADENIQTNASLADSLRLSPIAVQIGNDSLFLTADVWRDFMPGIRKDGSGLYCSDQLTNKDSSTIAPGLELRKQYVINGNQIWTSEHPAIDNTQPSAVKGFIRDGPKWGPDILVDVVCDFELGGKTYRIIVRQQKINATY